MSSLRYYLSNVHSYSMYTIHIIKIFAEVWYEYELLRNIHTLYSGVEKAFQECRESNVFHICTIYLYTIYLPIFILSVSKFYVQLAKIILVHQNKELLLFFFSHYCKNAQIDSVW